MTLQRSKEEWSDIFDTLMQNEVCVHKWAHAQRERVKVRCTINQFLDENEHEWHMLDNMCRARPWCAKKELPFPYPFRAAVKEMREGEEKYWLGEDTNGPVPFEPSSTREPEASPCPIITQLKPCKIFPPTHRVILFTPEFGNNETSYDKDEWLKVGTERTDIWVICWQGWLEFSDMKAEVMRWLLAFADGVSTVWFGHSFGSIVAYECLRECCVNKEAQCPNLPVALFVSGCPAPHLVNKEFRLDSSHPFLAKKMHTYNDYSALEESEIKALTTEFSMEILKGSEGWPVPSKVQRRAITGDLRVMRTYEFVQEKSKLPLPLFVFRHDEDPLVPNQSSTDEWSAYTKAEFQTINLEDTEDDCAILESSGHGFSKSPPKSMLGCMGEVMKKYQINKDVDSHSERSALPYFGDVDGDLPEFADCLIVGAGIAGVCQCRAMVQQSNGTVKPLIVEKTPTAGGIWRYYANIYSRVNTSEVGYRLMDQSGPTSRPNQDHSPTHDILRDIYTVLKEYAYDRVRCGWEVVKTDKQADSTYIVHLQKVSDTSIKKQIRTPIVCFCVNRRIGRRREVDHPGSDSFLGDIVYGYANEMRNLDFWGKRSLVVGAGAFAYENLRTSIENGAKHCTILGRRAGTTCPKWIDYIAFSRPTDDLYNTDKGGNMISFQYWQNCFSDAGLRQPDCWKEGLLKPDNHTISVSDLAYIGGFHGMVELAVGEIKKYHGNGHSVILKDDSKLEVDIVIKCTGFHLNTDVPQITGKTHIHPNTMMDYNMSYSAEPLLDGAQFGSAKGIVKDAHSEMAKMDEFLAARADKFSELDPDIAKAFLPMNNPFGSGYVGGALAGADQVAWLAMNPDRQKKALEAMGPPQISAVEFWASTTGIKTSEMRRKMLAHMWGYQGSDNAQPVQQKLTVVDTEF